MQPTYSIVEIKHLLRRLEAKEVNILKVVVAEEGDCYSTQELAVIEKMLQLRMNFLTRHKINFDFSSSYN